MASSPSDGALKAWARGRGYPKPVNAEMDDDRVTLWMVDAPPATPTATEKAGWRVAVQGWQSERGLYYVVLVKMRGSE